MADTSNDCACCHRPIGTGHKFSCVYGERHATKLTIPATLVRKTNDTEADTSADEEN